MFQSLADNVKKFRDFLADAKKDGSLQQFFDDAKDFTDKIGEAVVAVGKLIAALDNPEMRRVLIFMVGAFTKTVDLVTFFASLLAAQIHLWFLIGGAIKDAFGKVKGAVSDAVRVIKETFAPVGPWIHKALGNISWDGIKKGARNAWKAIKSTFAPVGPWFRARWHTISNAFSTAMGVLGRAASHAWCAIKSTFAPVGPWFSARWHTISSAAQNAWSAVTRFASNAWHAIQTGFSNAIGAVVRFFQGLPGRIGNLGGEFGRLASDWASAVMDRLRSLPGDIVGLFSGLAGRILNAIGSIDIGSLVHGPQKLLSKVGLATGGLVLGPQFHILGEAGPEAVVPLTGPLSAVDPAVRALAAFARGGGGGMTSGRGGRTVDIGGITVITPTQDAAGVAQQVVNRIAAASYI